MFPVVEPFYAGPVQLGESICWHPTRRTVWWVDILGRRIFEAGLSAGVPRILACSQMPGAIAPTAAGGLIGALHEGIYLIDPDSGEAHAYCAPPGHELQRFRFNDGKVDPRGRWWTGTLALDGSFGQSTLYRVARVRSIASMLEGVSISNGIAWSADERTMYYIDSPTRMVQAFAFDADAGTIGSARPAVQFEDGEGMPDGCALDAEGNLWVAHWGGSKVTCSDPRTGRRLREVALPVRNVTSCAFAGPRLDQLIITTAAAEQPADAGLQDGWVFRCQPGVSGHPLVGFIER